MEVNGKEDELKEIIEGVSKSFLLSAEDLLEETADNRLNKKLSYSFGFFLAQKKSGNGYFPVVNTNIKFIALEYWFSETIFFYYPNTDKQDEWQPDFAYRFGYENWQPYTFSLVYSNYTENRSIRDVSEQYKIGSYSLTWNLPVPDFIAKPFLIELEQKINCTAGMMYSPHYTSAQGEDDHDKIWGMLSFNVPLYGNLHLNFSLLHYVDSRQQQPWDPDYTYEIVWQMEYFSIAYKNYGGTRFPWRSDMPHDSGFRDGSIGIIWHWDWIK
jgi:hypothetical protein